MTWRFLAVVSLFPSILLASDCIAHRGDSIKHPDNTMEAIRSAWEAGADVVEVDVRMLKDGSLVLFHDAEIGKVPIKDLDQPKLQALIPEYRVPSLEEALLAGAAGKALLLDLKEGSEDFLKRVIGQVQTSTISGSRVILQSTSIPVLKSLREKMPEETALFYVTDLSDKAMDAAKLAKLLVENQLQGITAKGRQFVDAEYVSAFHKRGLNYYVWTINEPERVQHYIGLGVDGVITDDPAGFRKIVPARKLKTRPYN